MHIAGRNEPKIVGMSDSPPLVKGARTPSNLSPKMPEAVNFHYIYPYIRVSEFCRAIMQILDYLDLHLRPGFIILFLSLFFIKSIYLFDYLCILHEKSQVILENGNLKAVFDKSGRITSLEMKNCDKFVPFIFQI